jgi:hypothetical protein
VFERDGYCFAAFRGTTMTREDWSQNFALGHTDVCSSESLGGPPTCCSTRSGYYDAYDTAYRKSLELAVRKCAKSCKNKNECVVFTGHSQGGAVAAVAGLAMADLNPYVFTYGQPPTVDAPCTMISSERWFRFVNTKASDVGIAYDPVPFTPGLGADFFGHMILLGEDATGVANIGLDANDSFSPLNVLGFEAHSMVAGDDVPYPGYLDHLKLLVANSTHFPIRSDGFADRALCSQNKECLSGKCGSETMYAFNRCIGTGCTEDKDCPFLGRCDSGICIAKLSSCMPCDEDSDCAGGECLLFRCAGSSGKMDDNCVCKWDTDCASGRCELLEAGECQSQLPVGVTCNENSDCKSDYCTWKFTCQNKLVGGAYCTTNSQCASEQCKRFRCEQGEEEVKPAVAAEAMSADEL